MTDDAIICGTCGAELPLNWLRCREHYTERIAELEAELEVVRLVEDDRIVELEAKVKRLEEWVVSLNGGVPVDSGKPTELEQLRDKTRQLVEVRGAGRQCSDNDACRCHHCPVGAIIAALVAKQDKNERREWPDWRTVPKDRAIEHKRGPVADQGERGGKDRDCDCGFVPSGAPKGDPLGNVPF